MWGRLSALLPYFGEVCLRCGKVDDQIAAAWLRIAAEMVEARERRDRAKALEIAESRGAH